MEPEEIVEDCAPLENFQQQLEEQRKAALFKASEPKVKSTVCFGLEILNLHVRRYFYREDPLSDEDYYLNMVIHESLNSIMSCETEFFS